MHGLFKLVVSQCAPDHLHLLICAVVYRYINAKLHGAHYQRAGACVRVRCATCVYLEAVCAVLAHLGPIE